jgi:hypothetical protein
MHDQPKYEPLEESSFFADGRTSRPVIEGTIARGHLKRSGYLVTGKSQGELGDALPFPLTRELLERGKERYEIFCTPCHGQAGYGDGIVVKRGMRVPPSRWAIAAYLRALQLSQNATPDDVPAEQMEQLRRAER